jgi:hypothetical protein
VPVSVTYRWTLEEYLLRCEIRHDLAEILTEGSVDRDLFADAVDRWGKPNVSVIDADSLNVTPRDLAGLTLGTGVKATLLATALRLEQRASSGTIAAKIAIVVDRDYDGRRVVSRFLFTTDGHSMESYALAEPALQRFVNIGLGSGAQARGRKHVTSGKDLLARILTPAVELAAIRLALAELVPPLAPFQKWVDYLATDPKGIVSLKGDELVANVLAHHHRQRDRATVDVWRADAQAKVRANPVLLVRGHDFVAILHALLKSSWGQGVGGTNVKAWTRERLGRVLLLALPPTSLDATKLFTAVKALF